MADDDGVFRGKLRKLTVELRGHQAKCFELLEAIAALQDSVPTMRDEVKALFGVWAGLWGTQYNDRYAFAGAKDTVNFKRLLKGFTFDEVVARMKTFLASNDAFYLKGRHNLGMFVSAFNSFGATAKRRHVGGDGRNCPHDPRCESFAICRDKILAEGRAASATEQPF